VVVENRSKSEHVLLVAGELLSGGKQTRTVRQDVVLAPGDRVNLDVWCVEARRWEGHDKLAASSAFAPQSIQHALRSGAAQQEIWDEVARTNRALGTAEARGSLESALAAPTVRRTLDEVRRNICPELPGESVGYIFVANRVAVGAHFFGREDLAQELLPRLVDSYAVDCVVQQPRKIIHPQADPDDTAIRFFEQIRAAGSRRTTTPGSGSGIQAAAGSVQGSGVGLNDALVHFAAQPVRRIIPLPRPVPLPRPEPLR
jgi:hypothetical protein